MDYPGSCLAHNISVLWGKHHIEWETIRRSSSVGQHCCRLIDNERSFRKDDDIRCLVEYRENSGCFNRLEELRWFLAMFKHPATPVTQGWISQIIQSYLVTGKDYITTEAKDKIFAMMGLFDEMGQRFLDVDYNMSEADIYMRATEFFYQHSGSIEFLDHVERFVESRGRSFGLPSWTPDWTLGTNMNPKLDLIAGPDKLDFERIKGKTSLSWSSDGAPSTDCIFDIKSKTVKIKGAILDTIKSASIQSESDNANSYHSEQPDDPEKDSASPGSSTTKPLASLDENSYKVLGQKKRKRLRSDEGSREAMSSYAESSAYHIFEFQMEHQSYYIGRTDSEIKPGDRVCAFQGSKFPHILRRIQGDSGNRDSRCHQDHWTYIGPCLLTLSHDSCIVPALPNKRHYLNKSSLLVTSITMNVPLGNKFRPQHDFLKQAFEDTENVKYFVLT